MTELVDKVFQLQRVPLFRKVPEEYLVDLASVITTERYDVGDRIIEEGETGSALYVILSGRVRVLKEGRVIAQLEEGEIVGELAAFDPHPRSATVEATETTVVYRVSHRQLVTLINSSGEVSREIIRTLCRRLRETS